MRKIIFFVFNLFCFTMPLLAQVCDYTLAGHVQDADTREDLQAATVVVKELNLAVATSKNGEFEFKNLCEGQYTLIITHVHCEVLEKKVSLTKNIHLDIYMPHTRKVLGEVIVDAKISNRNTGFKKELNASELQKTSGSSLAEALSKLQGVNMLQTGSTIAKPVVHGLYGNRLLMINNGIRQEGQQWGNEHAPEIDPFIANKLIVIKGVDELKYGSDAIGGVILVDPKPLRTYAGYSADWNAAYFTNNKQWVSSLVWEQQFKSKYPLTYRVQGTFKKAANVATPHYKLNNTALQEANFSVAAGWKKNNFIIDAYYSHFYTRLGIFTGSHIGNITDLEAAIKLTRPEEKYVNQNTYFIDRPYQQVVHDLAKIKTVYTMGQHKFALQVANQLNHREEYDIVRNNSNTRPQMDLQVQTTSQELTWEHPRVNGFTGVAGVSLIQQKNVYRGRYFIPNYQSNTAGLYYIEKWFKHNWELQAGIRADQKNMHTQRYKSTDTILHQYHFTTVATSVNAIYRPNAQWSMNLSLGLSSRAPNVNELLSDGIHHGTATYEQGDTLLKTEKALHLASGISYKSAMDKLQVDILMYANHINNYIYQQPMPQNPVLTSAGAFPLLQYKQTNALLHGIDVSLNYNPIKALAYNSSFSYLYAKNKTTNDWLLLMPGNRLKNSISYYFKPGKIFTNSSFTCGLNSVFTQRHVPDGSVVKQDYKQPPKGYNLVQVDAETNFKYKNLNCNIGFSIHNMLNTVYREYLNSMRYFTDDMGLNICVRTKISFDKKIIKTK